MACSHAVCRISSVMAAIFTSSLRQTRSRRSCPRRCSLRRSSVRRSITRRSTTRRPCTPLPLSIACSSSRRHSAVRALKKRRICAAVRPDIRLSVASNASGGGRRFEDFDGKGSCCLVVGSLAATPTFQNHKRTTAGLRLSSFWGPSTGAWARSVGLFVSIAAFAHEVMGHALTSTASPNS